MPSGTVKYVGPTGSWGFISRDDKQPKVFLHVAEIKYAGFTAVEKGQRWTFDVMDRENRRPAAINLVFDGYAD